MTQRNEHILRIKSHQKSVKAGHAERLSDVLVRAGINLNLFCGGRGVCGKCMVKVLKGGLSPPAENEKTFRTVKKWDDRSRLACQTEILDNATIDIPEETLISSTADPGRTGIEAFPLDPAVKSYIMPLKPPTLDSPYSFEEICRKTLRKKNIRFFPETLAKGAHLLKDNQTAYAVVYEDRDILDLGPYENIYGFALDLGTTTVVMELIDLNTGKTCGTSAFLNPQSGYGADVLSRITHASTPEKVIELQKLIIRAVNSEAEVLLKKFRIPKESVFEFCLSGNTAMSHLFLGLPVRTLASAPYFALFSGLPPLPASSIGLTGHPRARLYVVPNIKSFVGGDVASGLAATGLLRDKGRFLFVDLGTNGEIVLKKGSRFTASSTAAGPAFEGMNLSCGMPAVPGAVTKVWYDGKIRAETAGGKKAAGICGSGYIDILAVLLENGILNTGGKLRTPSSRLEVADGVYITQKDIRELQLAAAAVKTGIAILLRENRLSVKDVEAFYIGGAFGNYLNIQNAQKIGLIPSVPPSRIRFRGNTSLEGARILLLSRKIRKTVFETVSGIRHFSLASHPGFQDRFIQALDLG